MKWVQFENASTGKIIEACMVDVVPVAPAIVEIIGVQGTVSYVKYKYRCRTMSDYVADIHVGLLVDE